MVTLNWTTKPETCLPTPASQNMRKSIKLSQRKGSRAARGVGGRPTLTPSQKLHIFYVLTLIILDPFTPRMTVAATEIIPTLNTIPIVQKSQTQPLKEDFDRQIQNLELRSGELLNTRMIRSEGEELKDKLSSADRQYIRLSRALERIHFGPLLRLRQISNRGATIQRKFDSFVIPNLPPEKKALSFFSRFYPVFQQHGGDGGMGDSMMNSYSPRRRVSFPQSGEIFPVGRFSRPIMRLRWGK